MPHNIIQLSPRTRVNDLFVCSPEIDAAPPLVSTQHWLITGGPNDKDTRFQADFYRQIACDIVVETVFDYPYPYISEKTLRSFACKRMLIVLGPVGVLKLLRSKGFETFDDIIDENYDLINDPVERFFAVVNEVNKFCNLPLDTIKLYMKTNIKKFDHNFLILQNLHDIELQQIATQFDIEYETI